MVIRVAMVVGGRIQFIDREITGFQVLESSLILFVCHMRIGRRVNTHSISPKTRSQFLSTETERRFPNPFPEWCRV
jgi:hypothetical protein